MGSGQIHEFIIGLGVDDRGWETNDRSTKDSLLHFCAHHLSVAQLREVLHQAMRVVTMEKIHST